MSNLSPLASGKSKNSLDKLLSAYLIATLAHLVKEGSGVRLAVGPPQPTIQAQNDLVCLIRINVATLVDVNHVKHGIGYIDDGLF